MNSEKEYYAFISYKREDEKWAVWLQHKLEHYKMPSNLNGRTDLPKEIRPIFRDQSDLAGGVLADEINKALINSKYLIVICSPRAAQSVWVGKEVQTFIDLGRTDKIIPFIIGGTAHAQNSGEECFPSALLNLSTEQELLGINIDEMGRDAAAVKVVAQMFGLKFDTLWQRYEREQKKKRQRRRVAVVGLFLVMAVFVVLMYRQWWRMKENQSRFVAEKVKTIVDDDPYLAQRIMLEVLPTNLKYPSRPLTIEAESVFYKVVGMNYIRGKSSPKSLHSISLSPNRERAVSAISFNSILIWDTRTGEDVEIISYGHDESVNNVKFSPNGNLLVSCSYDSTVRIWGASTYDQKQILKGHCDKVVNAEFSPDGKNVISSSVDSTIRIWDVETGYEVRVMRGLIGKYSHDGVFFATTALDNIINIWDRNKDSIINRLNYNSNVNTMAFRPNNKQIVATYDDQSVIVWDVETGDKVLTAKGYSDPIAVYSPDGKYILIKTWLFGKEMTILNAETGDSITTIEGENYEFCPDGKCILITKDKSIMIWNIATGQLIREIKCDNGVEWASFNSDNDIVSVLLGGERIVWNIGAEETYENIKIVANNGGSLGVASFSPDGQIIVSAPFNDSIWVWDAQSRALLHKLEVDTTVCFYNFLGNISGGDPEFSSDGNRVLFASNNDHRVIVYDTKNWEETVAFDGYLAKYTLDGKYILSVSQNNQKRVHQILIRDANTGDVVKVFAEYPSFIESLRISQDGKYIATVSKDNKIVICNKIVIWDAKTGKEIYEPLSIGNGITAANFSPDGKYVIYSTWGADGTLTKWNMETGEKTLLQGCTGTVLDIAFSRDGKFMATASDEIIIWDTERGIPKQIRTCPSGFFYSVGFSYDGKSILADSNNGDIILWSFPSLQDLIDQTRERFKDRPLTPEERHRYYLE